ncbi:hypothetical protein HBA55_10420 [Pseudomaricurvus alkylphenolicus]|uniref:hypothetical protein n=1 Tax=Pseudomaricurvus alkylphenolicus TaxID=1306991 RepID=UPI0014229102|nr:hypothetical protein [Pseudomaricurvus alkylphenolicus]NIB40003.1 hypothetical protein [Pseudomaricurvus alkylphenolicus]
MAINEIQRQTYLDAMGIDSYMPRWILPMAPQPQYCQPVLSPGNDEAERPAEAAGASPGVAADASTVTAASSADPSAAPQRAPTAEVGAPADALKVLAETPAQESPASSDPAISGGAGPQKASPAASLLASLDAPVPKFALSWWRIGEELLVIDSRHAELALPTEPLLINMLSALGFPRAPLPPAEVVRWPMVNNPHAAQGAGEARDTLAAMIETMLESQPVKHLLLMGEDACRYIAPQQQDNITSNFVDDDFYRQCLGKILNLPELSIKVAVIPSLSDLLQHPEQKADAWRALQPLRRFPADG